MDKVIKRIYKERLGECATMNLNVKDIYYTSMARFQFRERTFQAWIDGRYTARYYGNLELLEFEEKHTPP